MGTTSRFKKNIYIYIYEHTGIPQNDMGKLPLNDDDDDDDGNFIFL